ncbi:hypothetical protein [Streptomyces leeuwenhoekii]|uniref:hypothetical protein n=1 Tax=Streptomyces leeuwenhoekii TaxID=1437453 RepID=UPI0012FE935E|nr:hypothetical protein [Streptomyces leeuwenhoekii]
MVPDSGAGQVVVRPTCGGWLRLAHTPTPVLDLLRIVGLDTIIPLHPTLDDALAPQPAT